MRKYSFATRTMKIKCYRVHHDKLMYTVRIERGGGEEETIMCVLTKTI